MKDEEKSKIETNQSVAYTILSELIEGNVVTNGDTVVHAVGINKEGQLITYGQYATVTDTSKIRYSKPYNP